VNKVRRKYDMLCPDCNGELVFIINWRMDDKRERIPICNKCGKAYRDPKLGWEIEEEE